MTAKSVARTGQAGGAMLTLVAVVALLALAYIGYRALGFYRVNVAPFVADASNVVSSVASAARSLNPYPVTKDPDEVAQSLRTSFGIAPPEGYVGAFGFSVELLGEKHMQLMALIPKGVKPSDIFEGGRRDSIQSRRVHDLPRGAVQAQRSQRGARCHRQHGPRNADVLALGCQLIAEG